MDIALWVVAAVLALAMLAAGVMKLARPTSALVEGGQGWAEDFPAAAVKGIGALEVLATLALFVAVERFGAHAF